MSELLTFAELRFLVGNAPGFDRLAQMLPLPAGEAVAEAGLASLFARDKAGADAEGITVDAAVRAAAALLVENDTWVDLVLVRPSAAVSLFVGSGPAGTPGVVVSTTRPGCFQIDALTSELTAQQRLSSVVTALLDADGEALVYARTRPDRSVSVAAGRSASGEWLFGREGDEGGLVVMPRDAVEQALASAFDATPVA
ncbi:MAG: hypothetical protein ACTHMS_19815 [Jatrophihabitans sp.]|uniref:hypothetical protein n=1 Tax=Jatrophihabitans sp. TaxID=1932789 RepID=UPI003F7E6662